MGLRKLVVIPVVVLGFFVLAPAAAAWIANACLSIEGHTIYQNGTASCSTSSGDDFAAALGASAAIATDGAKAIVVGDDSEAFAFHGGEAYAGSIGDFHWNKAVAIGACIAEAVWSNGDSDFCGPHDNNVNP